MPKRAAGITAAGIKHLKPGRYADGGGLYLLVRSADTRFWLLRYVSPVTRLRREAGLGPASGVGAVTLAEARAATAEWRALLRAGRDPLAERDAADAAAKAAGQAAQARGKTFREVAALYIAAHEAGWRNAKHGAQWAATLDAHAMPHMGDLPVAEAATAHIMAALEPIWRTKPETASRVRGRIEAVLDYATARGWRAGDNPARWRGHLANLLPAPTKVRRVQHHAALPWREIGACMVALAERDGTAALALRFAILTAARSGEVRGARWLEIDMAEAVWTVPGERMKAGREHRVPLPDAALAVLRAVLPLRDASAGDFVFPGGRVGAALSDVAVSKVLTRIGHPEVTVHGFRSTFRDWCAEVTGHPREVAEAALAHTLSDKTEAAYRRSDLFEHRRRLMAEWAAYATSIVP